MKRRPSAALLDYARAELGIAPSAAARGMAGAIRDAVNRNSASGDTVVGVLFYGSCLRTGKTKDGILDFYILVDSYAGAYASRLLGLANRLLPPNVFYLEWQGETPGKSGDGDGDANSGQPGCGEPIRAKYAVVSLDDFARRAAGGVLDLTIWARFAQPSVLLFAKSPAAERSIAAAIASAAETTLAEALPLMPAGATSRDIWAGAFALTYSAELRSETPGKGDELYALDQARYDSLLPLILHSLQVPFVAAGDGGTALREDPGQNARRRAKWRWMRRRVKGKILSVLRLAKASFTFDGGIDYLAWKISRHSGVEVEIKPWQRRHPILAGLGLFWTLRRKGAFR